jgi:hypothetical protein
MYTAMAAKHKVPQVSDDVLDLFTDTTHSPPEQMDTEHIHGNQSQQTKQTAEGSTKTSGAAASN